MMYYAAIYIFALIMLHLRYFFPRQYSSVVGDLSFLILLFVLSLFVGFRGPGVDRDYSNYIQWIDDINSTYNEGFLLKDPAFGFILNFVSWLGLPVDYLFVIYAFLGLFFVAIFFRKALPALYWVAFFIYISKFFVVHEMTQIRAAVAIPVISLGLWSSFNNKKIQSLFYVFLAALFHSTTLLLFPIVIVLFFKKKFLNKKILLSFIFVGLFFGFFSSFVVVLMENLGVPNFGAYLDGTVDSMPLNPLNKYIIFKLSILLATICFLWDKLSDWERFVTWMVGLGIFLQYLFIASDVISWRISELFALFDVLLFVLIFKFLTRRYALLYGLIIYLVMALLFLSSIDVLNPYR